MNLKNVLWGCFNMIDRIDLTSFEDTLPTIHDEEVYTVLEATSQVVGKTNELVDNFNGFTSEINQKVLDIETYAEGEGLINAVDNKINTLIEDGTITGSPKGVFDSLYDLQMYLPFGDNNIYLITSTNRIAYFDVIWKEGASYIPSNSTASGVPIDDVGSHYNGNNVEDALQEVGSRLNGIGGTLSELGTNIGNNFLDIATLNMEMQDSLDDIAESKSRLDTAEPKITANEQAITNEVTARQNADALKVNKSEYDILQKRFDNLVMASKGIVYNDEVDDDVAYSKVVPTGAQKYATIDSIGGKSVVNEGSILSGKCDKVVSVGKNLIDSDVLLTGGKYTKTGDEYVGLPYTSGTIWENTQGIQGQLTLSYRVLYESANSQGQRFIIKHTDGTTVVAYPTAYNVWKETTLTSASGKTVELINYDWGTTGIISRLKNIQLEKSATPTTYVPYFSIDTPIPSSIQVLTGYGWSAGTVYNSIDFVNKKYVQRVASRPYESGDESDESVITDGTITYYELASPIETDLSAILSDDNFIEVEAGGTLTLHQQDDTQLSIPSTETYVIKVGDAI